MDISTITIENGLEKLVNINIPDFQKYFLVGYATMTHSAQGLSIGEPYIIHEWHRIDQRLKYVALSRSRKYSYKTFRIIILYYIILWTSKIYYFMKMKEYKQH